MDFDLEGARRAGYGDGQIADALAQRSDFDIAGARRAGYADADIIPALMKRLGGARALPEGVTPSTAGAGRGALGAPQTASEAQHQVPPPRRGGTRAEAPQPYGAGDERAIAPPPAPTGGSVFDRAAARGDAIPEPELTPESMEWLSLSPERQQELMARQRYAAGFANAPEARPASTGAKIGAAVRDMTSNPVARGAVAGLSQLGQVGVGALRAGADAVGADEVADFARGASGTAAEIAGGAVQGLRGNDDLAAKVTSSIINSAPAIAMGAMGGPALRTLFAQSAAADYAETGNLAHAGMMGAAEALGERFGFSEQIRLLKGVVKGMPSDDVAKVLGALLAKEIPGEQATTAMQFLIDKAGPGARNPNATFADYLKQAGETLEVTIGQTAVMGGGPATLTTARNQLERADRATERSAMNPAERAAKDAGFTRPTERRKAALDRLDDFAAEQGLPSKVIDAAKKQAESLPLAQVPGFFKKYTAAIMRRLGRPVDDTALGVLDEPQVDSKVDAEAAQGSQASDLTRTLEGLMVPAADLVDDGTGLAEPTAVDERAHAAATSPTNDLAEPTEAQKAAGNYAKGHARIAGMDISIENPEGSVRRGVDADGTPWENTMRSHYGYVRGSQAKDGDHVDVFIKPGTPEDYAGPVFVVDQIDPKTGKYDEAKAIIGAASQEEAEAIYRSNYAADWQGMGAITGMPISAFRAWAASKEARKPLGDINRGQPVGNVDADARQVAAAPDRGSADPGRSVGDVGLAAAEPGRVDRGAAAPATSGGPAAVLADADRPDATLSAPNAEPPPANPVAESLAPGRSADGNGAVARAQGAGGRTSTGQVEMTWNGKMGRGMARQALGEHIRDLKQRHPDLEFTPVPAPEFGENRWRLEGRKKNAAAQGQTDTGAVAGDRAPAVPRSTAPVAAAPKPSKLIPLDDERLKADDYRKALEMAQGDIGWTQRGGQMIRSGIAEAGEGNGDGGRAGAVVGRTQWLGPELWRTKPEAIGEDDARAAIRNALAGKPMTARQKRFVKHVLDFEAGRVEQDRQFAAEDAAERAAIMAEAEMPPIEMAALDDSDIPFDYRPEAPNGNDQGSAAREGAGEAGSVQGEVAGQVRAADAPGSEEARADETEGLTAPTPDSLRADAERARTAEATDRKEQKRLADKAKADDVAAGQGDLLSEERAQISDKPRREKTPDEARLTELRKRVSVLESLRACLNG